MRAKHPLVKVVTASVLCVLTSGSATAGGDLRVDWSTLDPGGGSSSGGIFSISGTIAQSDADPLQPSSGGVFNLTGGFWPGIAQETRGDQVFKDGFEGS